MLAAPAAPADLVFRVPDVLVRHAAAPRAVGSTRANVPLGNTSLGNVSAAGSGQGLLQVQYEEYVVEHEISTRSARASIHLVDSLDVRKEPAGCGRCSRRELQYCEWRVLADHCCCERRFLPEPFPWLPHTCYVGPHRCRTLAADCTRYARLRDCCCLRMLAERWHGILADSGPGRVGVAGSLLLIFILVVAVVP